MDTTERPIRVAIVDSGFDRTIRPARVESGFAIAMRDQPFVVSPNADDDDLQGHGTICAHVLLAASPDVVIVPVRVFNRTLETSPRVLAAAIELTCDQPSVDIISLSLSTHRDDAIPILYRACARAHELGITIVAAVDNATQGGYPALFDFVLAVGQSGEGSISFAKDTMPEFRVPSSSIHSFGLKGTPVHVGGTSFATPLAVACVAEVLKRGHRGATAVRNALINGNGGTASA